MAKKKALEVNPARKRTRANNGAVKVITHRKVAVKARAKPASEKSKVGHSIIKGLKEAIAYSRGEKVSGIKVHKVAVPPMPDIKSIRERLGLSQTEFAFRFGFSPSTLRNWEQGIREPETPARILLAIIDKEPDAVDRVLSGQK